MPQGLPAEPVRKLQAAVRKSKRTTSVRFSIGFVRRQLTGETPPLARLFRAGDVRLKLYLVLTMIATRFPFEIDNSPPATYLASMLNLEDPDKNGARRITDALAWLHREKFLERTSRPGKTPRIRVLQPGSSDIARGRYVSVPLDIWDKGWLLYLSGRALALYLVLLEATGGRPGRTAMLTGDRKAQYDLSDETWARAAAELEDAGLLHVEETFSKSSEKEEFELRRRRLRYTLAEDSALALK
jgi:hypothetical protein